MHSFQEKDYDKAVQSLIRRFNLKAAIFDLDGTLINNNHYHLLAWQKYLHINGISITEEEYNAHFNGRTNKDVIQYIYKEPLTPEAINRYALEKEALYRELYEAHIKPIDGLIDFLAALHRHDILMAIATSGIQVNIDFMFSHIPIKQYFPVVVNSSHISKGKPDPEIYLKAASLLNIPAENCLVFEDAIVGILSARSAGMQVVALNTTEEREALFQADLIIENYLPGNFDV